MHRWLILSLFCIIPQFIFAHGAHGTGFTAGLTHPIFGMDHLLVIFSIAIIGHRLMNEKPWLLSILFVIAMGVGGMQGMHEDPINHGESIIKGSIILCGIVLFLQLEFTLVGYALVAILLGYVHGHAHGVEMPSGSEQFPYIGGYILGAAIISLLGYGVTRLISKTKHYQILGIAIIVIGILIFVM